MKKILVLFFVLIALLIFTYRHEELGRYYRELEKNKQSTLLKGDTSNIQKIHLSQYTIEFSDRPQIQESGLPVDKGKFDQFLYSLSHIKIQREIELSQISLEDKKMMESGFRHRLTFIFSDRKIIYELGGKTDFSKAFYMRMKEGDGPKRLFLCFNNAPRLKAYNPSIDDDLAPYLKIVQLFSLGESFFHRLNLFETFSPVEKITVDNKRNRRFDFSMNEFRTTPIILSGLDYNRDRFTDFYRRLKSLKAKRIFPLKDILKEKVSTIKWVGILGGELNLFKKYGDKEGYFVPHQKIVYELFPLETSIFFTNVQDFWLKRPFGKEFDDKTTLTFSLSDRKKKESFRIPFSKEFRVESLSPKIHPKTKAFQRLFILIFGSDRNLEAQRVQKVTEELKDRFHNRAPFFMVEIEGRELHFLYLDHEVLLWDQSTNLVFHYLVGPKFELSFALSSFFDYIK
ncbi:MAG: hypothetical protein OXB88_01035 [Bacteriovoracales bacterium]|nr:hypothetical protein [Bacteriovoracales bacterium]